MERARRQIRSPLLVLVAAGVLHAPPSWAAESRFGSYDIHSILFIGKSDDHNQVHYGIKLDRDCRPIGSEPIYAYWLQLELGPNETGDLNFLDRSVYSIRHQRVDRVEVADGGKVVFSLQAAKDRELTVETHKDGSRCLAVVTTTLSGIPAHLERIFVKLGGLWRVDYIDLVGTEISNGKPLVERAHP